jgi:hypothetical protein
VPLLTTLKTQQQPLNLSSYTKIRSTRARKAWIASLKKRLRPRLVILRFASYRDGYERTMRDLPIPAVRSIGACGSVGSNARPAASRSTSLLP